MLSRDWVDQIFARLTVRYGAMWLRLWEGIDPDVVNADWADELSGLTRDDIDHGLANLPADRPPTVGQFRALCRLWRKAHEDLPRALPAPVTPVADHVLERVKAVGRQEQPNDPRAWAYRLKERHELGKGLTLFQISAYREALGLSQPSTTESQP